jgi:hypothetical protein
VPLTAGLPCVVASLCVKGTEKVADILHSLVSRYSSVRLVRAVHSHIQTPQLYTSGIYRIYSVFLRRPDSVTRVCAGSLCATAATMAARCRQESTACADCRVAGKAGKAGANHAIPAPGDGRNTIGCPGLLDVPASERPLLGTDTEKGDWLTGDR